MVGCMYVLGVSSMIIGIEYLSLRTFAFSFEGIEVEFVSAKPFPKRFVMCRCGNGTAYRFG